VLFWLFRGGVAGSSIPMLAEDTEDGEDYLRDFESNEILEFFEVDRVGVV
jgi:hypothetical protein